MPFFFKYIPCLTVFFCFAQLCAQPTQSPPYTIEIEPVIAQPVLGLHSFAFAQWNGKWLFAGGRTNGLHGMSSNDNFPVEYANNTIVVIDTATWQSWVSPLNPLPLSIADPLRSTNMQYIQENEYLYMVGGFGWDSTAGKYETYNTLTAIRVDSMINAVMAGKPIAPHIRQVKNSAFAVCGGEMGKLGNEYFLLFGHYFAGRYTDPPMPMMFTQIYSNSITKFQLSDNGTTINITTISKQKDTVNFHRRDLNAGPVVKPDGSFALGAYGGVFKYDVNLPYREPIHIENTGVTVDTSFKQKMTQYTTALMPVYDSVSGGMFSTFFGGISLYDYDAAKDSFLYDSLVPFIKAIATLAKRKNGKYEELMVPLKMPGYLGTNAKFILNENLPHYSNGVIRLSNLQANKKYFAGFIYGGIRANQPNLGPSVANDTIYRVYITPDNILSHPEANAIEAFSFFPNPVRQNLQVQFKLKTAGPVEISIYDIAGRKAATISQSYRNAGSYLFQWNIETLHAGIYFINIKTNRGERTEKMVVEE